MRLCILLCRCFGARKSLGAALHSVRYVHEPRLDQRRAYRHQGSDTDLWTQRPEYRNHQAQHCSAETVGPTASRGGIKTNTLHCLIPKMQSQKGLWVIMSIEIENSGQTDHYPVPTLLDCAGLRQIQVRPYPRPT